jgi:hypothetical protein
MPRPCRILVVLVTFLGAGLCASPAFAQSEPFVGIWVSERASVLSVTTLRPDGSFTTESFSGVERVASIEGRWEHSGNALKWAYLNPRLDVDDVNPIVSISDDRFTLTELDGSESTFFRKRIDPQSPALLPVGVGTGWVFDDHGEDLVIRVATRETIGGRDCYRVDWVGGNEVVQSEYWHVGPAGVTVVARRFLGVQVALTQPYLLLKRDASAGDEWMTGFTLGIISGAPASATVGPQDEIEAPTGRLKALRVTTSAPHVVIRRWYSEGVGLLRQETVATLDDKEIAFNLQLKSRLD